MIASIGCVIHCAALPTIVSALPFLEWEVHNESLEGVFWAIALCTALWYAWNGQGFVRWGFSVAAVIGTVGLLTHSHNLLHTGFWCVAIGAVYVLVRSRRARPCTVHDH